MTVPVVIVGVVHDDDTEIDSYSEYTFWGVPVERMMSIPMWTVLVVIWWLLYQ